MSIAILILQVIVALPKIFAAIKGLADSIEAANKKIAEQRHAEAVSKLRNAKSEEEQKDALRKLINNP